MSLVTRTVLLLVLLLVVALPFAPALGGGFIWDDVNLIQLDPGIRDLHQLKRSFTRGFLESPASPGAVVAHAYYRPLVTLSFMLDHQLHGLSPRGFHLTNLLLHLLAVAVFFRISIVLLGPSRPVWAVAATLIFALHPSRAESVCWISGRTELLYSLFWAGALGAFVAALRTPTGVLRSALQGGSSAPRAARIANRVVWLLAAWTAYVAAVLSKESAVSVALVVPVADWLLLRRRGSWLWCHAPLLLATAVFVMLRLLLPQDPWWWDPPQLGQRLVTVLQTVGHHALLVVNPLAPSMQVGAYATTFDWTLVAVGGGTLLAGVGGVYLALRRGQRMVAVLLLAVACTLAPVSNLVPLRLSVLAAERFLYLPMAGVALVVGFGLRRWSGDGWRGSVALGLVAVAVSAWAVTIHRRAQDFHDPLRFWSRELQRSPNNPLVEAKLGELLLRVDPDAVLADQLLLRSYRHYQALGPARTTPAQIATLLLFVDSRLRRPTMRDPSGMATRQAGLFVRRLLDLSFGRRPARVVLRFDDGVFVEVEGRARRVRDALAHSRPLLREMVQRLDPAAGQRE